MAKEYPPEDQAVEAPHCEGCKDYVRTENEDRRPDESCRVSGVEINNKYIAKRSRARCPLGKGKYNGKSRNIRSELRRAYAELSGECRPIRSGRPVLAPDEGSARNSGEVVREERAYSGSLLDGDSLRARREEGVIQQQLADSAMGIIRRHGSIPMGYRINVPQPPDIQPVSTRADIPSIWNVPEYYEFTWDGQEFRRTR